MEASIHQRRRRLPHFYLGIGLLSLLLGYLALRGIQNDIALVKKERINEHSAVAQQINDSINEEISAVVKSFLDSVANHQVLQNARVVQRVIRDERTNTCRDLFLLFRYIFVTTPVCIGLE